MSWKSRFGRILADKDFGLDACSRLNSRTNFPWLLSNLCKINGSKLVNTKEIEVVEKFGLRFGFMGLAEIGWITTLNCIDLDEVVYEDFVSCANRLAIELREVYKCDYVIALTHMRTPNDQRLCEEANGIDLVLGGHDHVFHIQHFPKCLFIKSGTDFQNLSEIIVKKASPEEVGSIKVEQTLVRHEEVITGQEYIYPLGTNLKVTVIKHDITRDTVPDPKIQKVVNDYDHKLQEKMKKTLFRCDPVANLKFSIIRSTQSDFIGLIGDIVRKETSADCSIINAGSIRADNNYEAGRYYSYGDVHDIYPFYKELCLIQVTGKDVYLALENGVSKYPALEGRFPQVSNIFFEFDPTKESGHRVNRETVLIAGKPLQDDKNYTIATTNFMADGKDGYESFKNCIQLIDENSRKTVRDVLLEFFGKLVLT